MCVQYDVDISFLSPSFSISFCGREEGKKVTLYEKGKWVIHGWLYCSRYPWRFGDPSQNMIYTLLNTHKLPQPRNIGILDLFASIFFIRSNVTLLTFVDSLSPL